MSLVLFGLRNKTHTMPDYMSQPLLFARRMPSPVCIRRDFVCVVFGIGRLLPS